MTEPLLALSQVYADTDAALRAGRPAAPRTWATGFSALDTALGGGLRAGELTLLGGPQACGKTTFALQVMRHVATAGAPVLSFSFEHDVDTLFERLLCQQAAEVAGDDGLTLRAVRATLAAPHVGPGGAAEGLAGHLAGLPGGAEAAAGLAEWAGRLLLHRSHGSTTSAEVIQGCVEQVVERAGVPLVVVDYLQKVPVTAPAVTALAEHERVTLVVEALKDLALEHRLPVLAVVAADREGIVAGRRVRMHHLRGASALAYEADVVLLLNDKYDVVARHHLVYDVGNAERFHDWVVLSVEKNRTGPDRLDFELRKRFAQSRFDPQMRPVAEQLVDERVYLE